MGRLRDITQETESEQRRRIAEMEKDVSSLDDIQCKCYSFLQVIASLTSCVLAQYESTLIKLKNA